MIKKIMIIRRNEVGGEFAYTITPTLLNLHRTRKILSYNEFTNEEKTEYKYVVTLFESLNNKKYNVLKVEYVDEEKINDFVLVEQEILKG